MRLSHLTSSQHSTINAGTDLKSMLRPQLNPYRFLVFVGVIKALRKRPTAFRSLLVLFVAFSFKEAEHLIAGRMSYTPLPPELFEARAASSGLNQSERAEYTSGLSSEQLSKFTRLACKK